MSKQQESKTESEMLRDKAYYSKWYAYILGKNSEKRAIEIGKKEGWDFLEGGAEGLGRAIEGGRSPMELAKIVHDKGYDIWSFASKLSYYHVSTTNGAAVLSMRFAHPMIEENVKYAHQKRPGSEFRLLDLGCGAGWLTEGVIKTVKESLPKNTKIHLRQEDFDALSTFSAALISIDIMKKFKDVTIETYMNDMSKSHPKDKSEAHVFTGLLSMLPYLKLLQQEQTLKRLNNMNVLAGVVTGQVNGFEINTYLKTGYKKNAKFLEGLSLEKRSIFGWTGFPRSFGDMKRILNTTAFVFGVGVPALKYHTGVHPNEKDVIQLYERCGWTVKDRKVFIPDGDPEASPEESKAIALSIRKKI